MRPPSFHHARGVVTLELAVVLPFLLLTIAFIVAIGTSTYKYEVAKKAADSATRYLASVSQRDIKNPDQISQQVALARAIIDAELSNVSKDPYPPSITILCGTAVCDGFSVPATVTVTIRMLAIGQPMGQLVSEWIGDGIVLTASVTMRYVGT